MRRTRSILNSNRDCRSNYKVFNRIDWRLKTFYGFLQYTLHSRIDLRFIPNSCFSGGEYGAHFARTLADVGKMWGNFQKEKSLNLLFFKGLAIVVELNSYPEPGSNRHGSESTGVWDQRVYRFRHLGFSAVQRYNDFSTYQAFWGVFFVIMPLFCGSSAFVGLRIYDVWFVGNARGRPQKRQQYTIRFIVMY